MDLLPNPPFWRRGILLNLGNQGSGIDGLVPDDQGSIGPHPHHETAGELDAFDGASKPKCRKWQGFCHWLSFDVSEYEAHFLASQTLANDQITNRPMTAKNVSLSLITEALRL
jgi:hypothetical protein